MRYAADILPSGAPCNDNN